MLMAMIIWEEKVSKEINQNKYRDKTIHKNAIDLSIIPTLGCFF